MDDAPASGADGAAFPFEPDFDPDAERAAAAPIRRGDVIASVILIVVGGAAVGLAVAFGLVLTALSTTEAGVPGAGDYTGAIALAIAGPVVAWLVGAITGLVLILRRRRSWWAPAAALGLVILLAVVAALWWGSVAGVTA